MNLILARKEELNEQQLILTDRRADHIVKVLQSNRGDTVRLGIIDGPLGTAVIESLDRRHPRSVTLSVDLRIQESAAPRIDLILALARPIMMRRILSQATALGVGRFIFIHANRVEKSFWDASLIEKQNYEEHLIHGLEQAVDTRLPEVTFHRRFKPFVEDYLPQISREYSHCLIAHPEGDCTLSESMSGSADRILLAIGPEGGWVDYEVDRFGDAGFVPCSLGERILKVDTAVVALHSRVSQILEMKAKLA